MLTITAHSEKLALFEEFLLLLVDWFCEAYKIERKDFNNHPRNDLSKLKIIKLHFFAVSTSQAALAKFDSFYAMPYGHVETDIYSNLGLISQFRINSSNLEIVNINRLNELIPSEIPLEIIKNIKQKNFDLIKYPAFQLVELSHKWLSWRKTYNEAVNIDSYSKKINPEIILKEDKYYTLFF
jgi:uncharacterized phage-associated protein